MIFSRREDQTLTADILREFRAECTRFVGQAIDSHAKTAFAVCLSQIAAKHIRRGESPDFVRGVMLGVMAVTSVDAVPLLEFLEPARPRLSGCGHRCFHDEPELGNLRRANGL